ncbi:hypothetical protein Micbo1qcDRAFT_177098 [Microdochium bolleyi]|uniref:Heterokaryon incompatibility domain-containing protein n=1 Tax=Microdochium bolleyi TaxID=196109 RepID=A0A136IY93_9PEZI|nr:hypothetical protein Micbo1qcDRAFT_177098 [Microdochium bolleyi]
MNNAPVWHARGWTFEEYVFSRRLLYVFTSEVIFSYSTGTYWESIGQNFVPEPAGSTWGDSGTTPPSMASRLQARFNSSGTGYYALTLLEYIQAVEEYTARELSVEEDRIEAFAGLVAAAGGSKQHGVAEQALLKHGHQLPYFEALLTWQHLLQYDADGPKTEQIIRQPMRVHFLDRGGSKCRPVAWFGFSQLGDMHILGLPRPAMTSEMDSSGRLILQEFGNKEDGFSATIVEEWSISPTSSSMFSTPSRVIPTLYESRKPGRFCIIAGLGYFYIMALKEVEVPSSPSSPSSAKRAWVTGISKASDQASLQELMAAGGAVWTYVCIV